MFARREGAVAAPTAWLHLDRGAAGPLDAARRRALLVTLHVGAGTFLPVKVDDTGEHRMHAEWCEVPRAAAGDRAARARGGRVVAVGTTVLRLLEMRRRRRRRGRAGRGETRLFVTPGFRFRVVDLLLTNFHLPRSDAVHAGRAFAGLARIRRAYAHAIARGLPLLQLRRRLPAGPPEAGA